MDGGEPARAATPLTEANRAARKPAGPCSQQLGGALSSGLRTWRWQKIMVRVYARTRIMMSATTAHSGGRTLLQMVIGGDGLKGLGADAPAAAPQLVRTSRRRGAGGDSGSQHCEQR
jgi:hypothetical protein